MMQPPKSPTTHMCPIEKAAVSRVSDGGHGEVACHDGMFVHTRFTEPVLTFWTEISSTTR